MKNIFATLMRNFVQFSAETAMRWGLFLLFLAGVFSFFRQNNLTEKLSIYAYFSFCLGLILAIIELRWVNLVIPFPHFSPVRKREAFLIMLILLIWWQIIKLK